MHIGYDDAQALDAWMTQGGVGHTASILGYYIDSHPDVLESISGRGPSSALPDVIVPTVVAPGTEIIAAQGINGAIEWGIATTGSLAAAHTAGAVALMKGLHPTWTPAEIHSALASTAYTGVLMEDGVTPADPFNRGSGRLSLGDAARAGLVQHESLGAYLAANPANGGGPKILNLPSMADSQCVGVCSWTRRFENSLGQIATWSAGLSLPPGMTGSVIPSSFTLGVGDRQDVTVEVDVTGLPEGVPVFAELQLTEGDDIAADAHLPIAVTPVTSVLPERVVIDTRRNSGSIAVGGLRAIEIPLLTTTVEGMVVASREHRFLSQDPTNGDPYDNLDDGTTFFVVASATATTQRLVAEIVSSDAPDMDLFVGTGSTPSAATQVCASTTGSFIERCEVMTPATGDWWILVQSWTGSGSQPDAVHLAYGMVDADQSNLQVSGPMAVPANTEFGLTLLWDEATMQAGDRLYGSFSLGTSEDQPGNLGRILVDPFATRTTSPRQPMSSPCGQGRP